MEPEVEVEGGAGAGDDSGDGVDVSLIRRFLALTPAERLEFLDDRCADIERMREWRGRGR
ncbi:MAG TPA: hypothetical protein VN709_05735 [Terriglobales bacterium]|nr:hypothetical protein [Terriglobales bacterium]